MTLFGVNGHNDVVAARPFPPDAERGLEGLLGHNNDDSNSDNKHGNKRDKKL